jgi:hypothetical protein
MALPIYESGNIKLTDAPSLQYVDIQQQEKTNQRIGQFLQFASEVTGSLATDYAQEQAIKYTIANPITKDRIDASIASGTDPLQGILTGGMDYNAALKKATAQQTAGVLENELHAHFSDVIARVDRNELTNREEILNELQSPIQGQIKFFSQIDPEIASAYGNQATNIATNKYQTALALLNKKAEEKSLIESEQYGINASKDFDEFLRNNPGASAAAIKEYINASETVAMQNSYKFSSKANELQKNHKAYLDAVKNDFLSEEIAKEFQGQDILSVVDDLRKGKSAYSKHYNGMDPLDKIKFEQQIKNELSLYSSRNAELVRKIKEHMSSATFAHQAGKKMSTEDLTFLSENVSADDGSLQSFQALKQIDGLVDIVNNSSMADIRTQYLSLNKLVQKGTANDKDFVYNVMARDFYKGYLDNSIKQLNADPTEYILATSGELKDIDFASQDTLKEQLQSRLGSLRVNGEKYNISKPPLFTDTESTQLVAMMNALPATGKVQLVNNIVNSVPKEYAYDVFKQIAPKDVKIAHMGQLLLHDANPSTIQFMANGMEALAENDIHIETPDTYFANTFDTAFDKHPGMKQAILESAQAIYTGKLMQQGKALSLYTKEGKQFNSDLYKESLMIAAGQNATGDKVMGGVVQYNGKKIALPNTIDQNDFDSRMNNITKANVIEAMVTQVAPNVMIPIVTNVNGKYYKNEYDPLAPNKYTVSDVLVESPLLEFDTGGIIPQEFDLYRLKDAQFEMADETHAIFMTPDGEYFDAAVNGGEKLTIDLNKLYGSSQATPTYDYTKSEVFSQERMLRMR